MNIEIDHIFCIVSKNFTERDNLSVNLPIGYKRSHLGQGTEAKFLAFEKNYLEFIWLRDEKEASTNELKLNERFNSKRCPFGIAFRGTLTEKERIDFWEYKPENLPSGSIWVHNSHLTDFSLPMIFVMDLKLSNESYWPVNQDRWKAKDILYGQFESVVLNGPVSNELNNFPGFKMNSSDRYSLKVNGISGVDLSALGLIVDS